MDDKKTNQANEDKGAESATQDKIHWHEAFYEALQYELSNYKDYLIFENEKLLSKEALKMDVLIIKKSKDIRIEKNIGRIFEGHNIFEYKSETDYLSVNDYNKVLGYALLYASFEKISLSDVTISFAVSRHPRKLLKYLEDERQLKVEEVEAGIYYVTGDIISIQILEQRKLSSGDNLFLKSLRSDVDSSDVYDIAELWEKEGWGRKNKFLEIVMRANKSKFREVSGMSAELKKFL